MYNFFKILKCCSSTSSRRNLTYSTVE